MKYWSLALLLAASCAAENPDSDLSSTPGKSEPTKAFRNSPGIDGATGEEEAGAANGKSADKMASAGDIASNGGLHRSNQRPRLETPAYRAVGVGQNISFGLHVVDPERDQVKVELVQSPTSVKYDPYTLTVDWTPTKEDSEFSVFRVKISEYLQGDAPPRVTEYPFTIVVTPLPVPLPVPRILNPGVEQFLSIHDPARLATANKEWPLDKLLVRAAQSLSGPMKKREARRMERLLYNDLLRELARVHDNPTLDPDSKGFNKKVFERANKWKLVSIRPRLDKKWFQLRLVYKAPSPEDVFVMLAFKITDRSENSEEARKWNNYTLTRLVWSAFFTKKGGLKELHWLDRKAHAKTVAKFVSSIVRFKTSERPWAGSSFLGLFTGARLGGGSTRGANGEYVRGTGWAWSVADMTTSGKRLRLSYTALPAVVTAIAEKDGEMKMACAPDFSKSNERLTSLCLENGGVLLPGLADGKSDGEVGAGNLVGAGKDAPQMFRRFKTEEGVSALARRDSRRDHFEDVGMSCAECHQRTFAGSASPVAGDSPIRNPSQSQTFFAMTPTTHWAPFILQFQRTQACAVEKAFKAHTDVEASLGCIE